MSRQVDVVIIGSGFAGLASAVEAGNLGASVLILEKMDTAGGNSIWNAGQVAAVGTRQQIESNIEDSQNLMVEDMMKAGRQMNHRELLERLVSESKSTAEWLECAVGVQFRSRLSHMGGHSVPRTLCTVNSSGRDIIEPLFKKIQEMTPRVELQTSQAVEELVVNNDRVIGVRTKNGKEIHVNGGVIIASGGFGADVKFRKIQNPSFAENIGCTNQPGATAEMLKCALRLGATPVQLSQIQLGPWTSPDEEGFGFVPLYCIGAGFRYGILVDPFTAQRFCNEMGNRDERSRAILKTGHPAICIADAVGSVHSLEKDLSKIEPALLQFPDLDSLAKHYGMDSSRLHSTIENYNNNIIEQRADSFGKPLRSDVKPIAQAPFYACRIWPKVHHCCGGVQIDTNARVLHIDTQKPIPNLFAAGEIVGGIHGADRLGSCATTDCLVYGRIAGRNAAQAASTEK